MFIFSALGVFAQCLSYGIVGDVATEYDRLPYLSVSCLEIQPSTLDAPQSTTILDVDITLPNNSYSGDFLFVTCSRAYNQSYAYFYNFYVTYSTLDINVECYINAWMYNSWSTQDADYQSQLNLNSNGTFSFSMYGNDTFTSILVEFDMFVTNNSALYDDGYNTGEDEGYTDGYDTGYSNGYNDGYSHALDTHDFTFTNLFASIADTPILYLRRLFGFELFGISIMSVFMSLFTALIVIHLIKKVF